MDKSSADRELSPAHTVSPAPPNVPGAGLATCSSIAGQWSRRGEGASSCGQARAAQTSGPFPGSQKECRHFFLSYLVWHLPWVRHDVASRIAGAGRTTWFVRSLSSAGQAGWQEGSQAGGSGARQLCHLRSTACVRLL